MTRKLERASLNHVPAHPRRVRNLEVANCDFKLGRKPPDRPAPVARSLLDSTHHICNDAGRSMLLVYTGSPRGWVFIIAHYVSDSPTRDSLRPRGFEVVVKCWAVVGRSMAALAVSGVEVCAQMGSARDESSTRPEARASRRAAHDEGGRRRQDSQSTRHDPLAPRPFTPLGKTKTIDLFKGLN